MEPIIVTERGIVALYPHTKTSLNAKTCQERIRPAKA